MWGHRREIARLQAALEEAQASREQLARRLDAAEAGARKAADIADARTQERNRAWVRLDRALRGTARWRAEAAGLSRLVRDQQRQLDSLLGLDASEVAAGVGWQTRRADKRPGVTGP
ncbi:hypothetical protein [Streptomyces sp. B15]|uniref:hypothetical protein n=1 Tax=Streptomyces sp. B15 TaxID=1537797 RepID=UPI001B378EEF|nr:hypothetical protein [Streptomyces sp. B15]MBQ1122596.1 hypothetical protein [Streptomyces sp. B15]